MAAVRSGLSPSSPLKPSERTEYEAESTLKEDGGLRMLTSSFIGALHKDSESSWLELLQAVSVQMSAENSKLKRTRSKIAHYLHRVFSHVAANRERLGHLSITRALEKAFPSLSTEAVNHQYRPYLKTTVNSDDVHTAAASMLHGSAVTSKYFPVDFFQYSHKILPKTFQGELVTVGHLTSASLAAEQEMKQFERVMKKEITRPEEALQVTLDILGDSSPQGPLNPIFMSSAQLTSMAQPKSMGHLIGPTDLLKTELDVISTFARGELDGKVDFVYLNYRLPPHLPRFDPYSLVVVSKVAVDPEHYVISRFGIVHVYPDGSKENYSFAEWCAHAITYKVLKEIPVFKKFFMQKMVTKWKHNMRSELFERRCKLLNSYTLRYFDDFSSSSIKIKHLANESLTLSLVDVKKLGHYLVEEFEEEFESTMRVARKPLLRLMKLSLQIMSEVESKKTLAVAEIEAEISSQPFVSDLPISKQKENASRLAQRLALAKKHEELLKSFALFVDRIISSSLVLLVERSSLQFVRMLLELNASAAQDSQDTQAPQGLFTASLCIRTTQGSRRLATCPPWSTISSLLVKCLNRIAEVLVDVVGPVSKRTTSGGRRAVGHHHKLMLPSVSLSPHAASFKERLSVLLSRGQPAADSVLSSAPLSAPPLGTAPIVGDEAGVGGGVTDVSYDSSPLDKENFRLLLLHCESLSSDAQLLEGILASTGRELREYLAQQLWLEEAQAFVSDVAAHSSAPHTAKEVEATLSRLEQWMANMAALSPVFRTCSGLVSVSCQDIKSSLDPALQRVFKTSLSSVHRYVQSQCAALAQQLDSFCNKLMARRYDLRGFLEYSKLVSTCENYLSSTNNLIEELGSMSQVLKSRDIRGEKLGSDLDAVMDKWQTFCSNVASEVAFVAKQTPSSIKALVNTIQNHEEDMERSIQDLLGSPYSDAHAEPIHVLGLLEQCQEEVSSVSSFFQNVTAWQANILEDTPSSQVKLQRLQALLQGRKALWTDIEACGFALDSAANMPFKKLNVEGVLVRTERSLKEACELRAVFPEEDEALCCWIDRLKDFQCNLNILKRLNSPAIKPVHWQSIFAAMGVRYDRSHLFTLNDLQAYGIAECLDNVLGTCLKAEEENRLDSTLSKMRTFWEVQALQLDGMPSIQYSFAINVISVKKTRQSGGKERTTTFRLESKESPMPMSYQLYVLVDVEEVLVTLEDHVMNLQVLLESYQLSKVSWQVSQLLGLLQPLHEVLTQLVHCQKKWKNLLKLLSGLEKKVLSTLELTLLQQATKALQDIMHEVFSDHRALSLVQKQRGTRELQGSALRTALKDIASLLDGQMDLLQAMLTQARLECPRLFFASDEDVLESLTHTSNPLTVSPLIATCFPGICSMRVAELYGQDSPQQNDGYNILSVEGPLGESLTLLSPLPLGCRPPKDWLVGLEGAVRVSLSNELTHCLDSSPPLIRLSHEGEHMQEAVDAVLEWLGSFSHQCVLLAVEIVWSDLIRMVAGQERPQQDLAALRDAVEGVQKTLGALMFQLPNKKEDKGQQRRLFALIGKMVILVQNKAFMLNGLLESQGGSGKDGLTEQFDYQSLLLHRSSRVAVQRESSQATRSQSNASRASSRGSNGQQIGTHLVPSDCQLVHMGQCTPYGFEFQSLVGGPVHLPPRRERSLVHLVTCMRRERVVVTPCPPRGDSSLLLQPGLAQDLAQVLGRPHYSFALPRAPSPSALQRLVLGAVGSGGVLSLVGRTGKGPAEEGTLSSWMDCFTRCALDLREAYRKQLELTTPLGSKAVADLRKKSSSLRRSTDGRLADSQPGSAHQGIDWYSPVLPDCRRRELVSLSLFGCSLPAHPTLLVGLEGMSEWCALRKLPQELTAAARVVHCSLPDLAQLTALHMVASGFQHSSTLAPKLTALLADVSTMVQPALNGYKATEQVVSTAGSCVLTLASSKQDQFYLHTLVKERAALARAVGYHLRGRLPDSGAALAALLTLHLEGGQRGRDEGLFIQESFQLREMKSALEKELQERQLQELPLLVDKCVDLHRALQTGGGGGGGGGMVVLSGPGCSGKSTARSLLAATYRRLRLEGSEPHGSPRVKTTVLHPAEHTIEELFGSEPPSTERGSVRGILPLLCGLAGDLASSLAYITHPDSDPLVQAKFSAEDEKCCPFQHWVVLQGPLSPEVASRLIQLLQPGTSVLSGGALGHTQLPGVVRIIVETESCEEAPLSELVGSGACSVVGFPPCTVPWTALLDGWMEEAKTRHNLNSTLRDVLRSLLETTLPLVLPACTAAQAPYPLNRNQAVRHFLRVLSAMLLRSNPPSGVGSGSEAPDTLSRTSSALSMATSMATSVAADEGSDEDPVGQGWSHATSRRKSSVCSVSAVSQRTYTSQNSYLSGASTMMPPDVAGLHKMSAVFCYTTVWALYPVMCGSSYEEEVGFNQFVRTVLSEANLQVNPLPEEGLVTEYFLDFRLFVFKSWREKCVGIKIKHPDLFSPVVELVRSCQVAELLLAAGYSVALLGEQGCGKTEAVCNLIESKLPLQRIVAGPETTSRDIRTPVLDKHTRKQRSRAGAGGAGLSKSQKSIFFVDDLQMSLLLSGGRGCPVEAMYQAAVESRITDPARTVQIPVHNVQFLTSLLPHSLSSFSSKFLSQLVPVLIPKLSSQSVSNIFNWQVTRWLNASLQAKFDEDLRSQLVEALSVATATVHLNVSNHHHQQHQQQQQQQEEEGSTAPPVQFTPTLTGGASLWQLLRVCAGLQLLSCEDEDTHKTSTSLNLLPIPKTTSKREKTGLGSRRRSSLTKQQSKQGKLKDELTRLARGRRKLKASLETDEEASRVILLRTVIRLWCHECARTYGDRWTTAEDSNWVSNLINHAAKISFCGPAALNELGARSERSAVMTARRKGKRPGRNLPVLPDTAEDEFGSDLSVLESIQDAGYSVDLLSQALHHMRLSVLLPLNQISLLGEDLSQLLFAPVLRGEEEEEGQGLLTAGPTVVSIEPPPGPSTASLQPESLVSLGGEPLQQQQQQPSFVYRELDDREAAGVVEQHLRSTSHCGDAEGIAPHRKLTEQVLRISRILHLTSSHAVLFGPKGSGKKTACKIAAGLVQCHTVSIAYPSPPSPAEFTALVREACSLAAFEGRDTALVLSGRLTAQQWSTIYMLMKEGDVLQSIFSSAELLHLTSRMQTNHSEPGSTAYPKHLKYSTTVEVVRTMLRRHLHVLVCWSVEEGRSQGGGAARSSQGGGAASMFSLLCQAAGYSMHVPGLGLESCSEVALRRLETATDPAWRDGIGYAGGCAALAELLAHIHVTAAGSLDEADSVMTFTPRTLLSCIRVGHQLSVGLDEKEKLTLDEVETLERRLRQCEQEVGDMGLHMQAVQGDIAAAQRSTEDKLKEISLHRDVYVKASQECKEAEKVIKKQSSNVEHLMAILEQTMDQVSQEYSRAVRTLSSLQKNDILELMSYKSPPETLRPALEALCVVFDRPKSWDDCKQLLNTKNFFEHLVFFDRDHLPKAKVKYLERVIAKKRLDSALVVRGSRAGLPISSWLKALTTYHSTRAVMIPHEQELQLAKDRLTQAKQTYSLTKYKMEEVKEVLERKLQEHKSTLHRLRSLEKHRDHLSKTCKEATELLESLKPFKADLATRKERARARCFSSSALGMIVAGMALYAAPLSPQQQGVLLSSWVQYCRGSVEPGQLSTTSPPPPASTTPRIPIEEVTSISSVFAEDEFTKTILSYSGTQNVHTVTEQLFLARFLATSSSCLIPVVFDPSGYLQSLAQGRDATSTSTSTSNGRCSALDGLTQKSASRSGGDRRPSSRVSFCEVGEVLSLPGVSSDSAVLPAHVRADGLTAEQVAGILEEPGLSVLSFSSADAVRPEVVRVLSEHLSPGQPSDVAVVVFKDAEVSMRGPTGPTSAATPALLQQCLPQSSSLACQRPRFTALSMQLGPHDLMEYFKQKMVTSLAPAYSSQYRALMADISTHVSSIKLVQTRLDDCISSADRMLDRREAIAELVQHSTGVVALGRQRLEDTRTQLARHREELKVFTAAARHCCLLFSSAWRTYRLFARFSLSLPQMEEMLRSALKKLSCAVLPLEPSGLAATASEQVNGTVLPCLAAHLGGRHYTVFLYLTCLQVWRERGEVEAAEEALLTALVLDHFSRHRDSEAEEEEELKAVSPSDALVFGNLQQLERLPSCQEIAFLIASQVELWAEYFLKSSSLVNSDLPSGLYGQPLFRRLLIWALFYPQKLSEAIVDCAVHTLSPSGSIRCKAEVLVAINMGDQSGATTSRCKLFEEDGVKKSSSCRPKEETWILTSKVMESQRGP
uniref:Dynein-1-beta heavy chain n=1 Tax=Halisarca dujardinii TaxID=2583056 RepID=A0A9F1UCN2_HALDU|nr:dynein-1-beta heavy chain [Halisarca dujardinii]